MLEAIRLVNFKAFRNANIPLGHLTLLAGLNGSGKSTVLQALGLLRQSHDAGFLKNHSLALNGDLVELGTGLDILNHGFEEPFISIAIVSSDSGTEEYLEWKMAVDTGADVLSYVADRSIALDRCRLFRSGFQFLRADRITPSVTFPKSQNAVRNHRSLGSRGEYTAHYLLEFGSEKIASDVLCHPDEPEALSLLAQVNSWLQEFSPGVRVEPHSVPMTDFVRLAFTYRGEGASYGDPLRPTNVGFGLTHSLPVIAACLGASPGSLLLVENPEAQLHPRGQLAIGRLLALTAATGVQVIVESHSDHVLNGIRLAIKERELSASRSVFHFFKRQPSGEGQIETPQISDEGRLSYWPCGFFDEWERSLDRLLD